MPQPKQGSFSPILLQKEWNAYHIPFFTVAIVFLLLINCLIVSIFVKIIKEIPLFSLSENLFYLLGTSLCAVIVLALSCAYILLIKKAWKIKQEIIHQNSKTSE